jgi:hypothetical protein
MKIHQQSGLSNQKTQLSKNPDSYLSFLKIPFLGDSNKPNKSSLYQLNIFEFKTSEDDVNNKMVLLK